jgi:hypothetical protein
MYYLLFLFLAVPLLAQDQPPASSPTPEASATPAASPAESPAPKTADEDLIPLPPDAGAAEAPIVSESEVPKPALDASMPDSAFADPNAVIPDDASAAPAPPTGPSAGELDRKIKIRYQEVRTEVEKDPAVVALKEQAKSAKTFEDERAALREYYRLLFKKMKKVDAQLSARCDVMESAYIARLAQSRIEPTIPLNLPPAPEPVSD